MKHDPLTRQRSPWVPIEPIVIGDIAMGVLIRQVSDGVLRCIVGEEPGGWHLSISFVNHKGEATRYPTWDEIFHARAVHLPPDIEFVMFLPPEEEYVAVHASTFHLHEYPERETRHPINW